MKFEVDDEVKIVKLMDTTEAINMLSNQTIWHTKKKYIGICGRLIGWMNRAKDKNIMVLQSNVLSVGVVPVHIKELEHIKNSLQQWLSQQ